MPAEFRREININFTILGYVCRKYGMGERRLPVEFRREIREINMIFVVLQSI